MDWKSVKFDWNRARAFLVTVEEGSLSAASRALGMTQPTLGRQVSALEDELGVVLFERVGRGLTLTPTGLDLVEHVRAMGNAASQVSLAASGKSETMEGTITIAASEIDSVFRLPPILAKLRRTEPGIDIEVAVSNSVSDLRRREADIAIRSFRPTEPDLIGKKIMDVKIRLYATPDYLRSIGDPQTPEDTQGAEFIGFDRTGLVLKTFNSLKFDVSEKDFPIVTTNQLLQWELVKQGIGIAILPEDVGDNEPRFTRAFAKLDPIIVLPMWLVCHREVNTSRRVRLVFDLLAKELAAGL